MGYEYTGRVVEIGELKQISDNYSVKEIVLSKTEIGKSGQQFTKHAVFSFGNTALLMGIVVGDEVKVSFDAESRRSPKTGGWFTGLRGWKIEPVSTERSARAQSNHENWPTQPPKSQAPAIDDDSSDLPF